VMPVPGFALQVVLGELAGEALRSQRVMPAVLTKAGFRWAHPTLESALRAALEPEPSAAR
jgi:NAD dependent epimerase/dehydratase family enzyme